MHGSTAANYLKRSVDDAVFDFGGGAFTVSLWVKPTSYGGFHTMIEKFEATPPGGNGWTFLLFPEASRVTSRAESNGVPP